MDEWSDHAQSRVGTDYGCEMIRRLLIALGVNDFSEMKGRHIWVIGKGSGIGFKPTGIQKLKNDKGDNDAVIFADVLAEFAELDANGMPESLTESHERVK